MYVATGALMISGEHIVLLLRAQLKFADVPAVQIKETEDADRPRVCDSINRPVKSEDVIAALKHCF